MLLNLNYLALVFNKYNYLHKKSEDNLFGNTENFKKGLVLNREGENAKGGKWKIN